MAYIDFNASAVPEDTGPEPLPAGDYCIYIESSDIRTEDDGTQKLSMVAKVIQPEQYAGRTLFPSFTMYSANADHVKTGQRLLALVCKAVGVIHPRDSVELHDKPFFTRVVPKAAASGKVYSNLTTFWSTASQPPPMPKTAPKMPAVPQAAHPAKTGFAPPAQPWQQPAPPAVPPVAQPAQQQLDLHTQYRTQPSFTPPPQQSYAPPQVPQFTPPAQSTPPWAQQLPPSPPAAAQPPQQSYAPPQQTQDHPPTMYDQNGDRIPY